MSEAQQPPAGDPPTDTAPVEPESTPQRTPAPAGGVGTPRPAGSGTVPPPPGPVFVPAGLGLPVGYHTPAPPAGSRSRTPGLARHRVAILLGACGLLLGLLTGGVAGAGIVAVTAGDSHDHGQVIGGEIAGHSRGDGDRPGDGGR